MRQILISVLLGICLWQWPFPLRAHEVVWWDNLYTGDPSIPLVFALNDEDIKDLIVDEPVVDYVGVVPTYLEPCTVQVNLDPVNSEYISATVLAPNPAVWVDIAVRVLRVPPPGQTIKTKISGEWHATKESGCTAVEPNRFEVPIVIAVELPWVFGWSAMRAGFLQLQTPSKVALQCGPTVNGPWWNIGVGNNFELEPEGQYKFFRGIQKQGGDVVASFTDSMGVPLNGLTLGLPLGGPAGTTSLSGGVTLQGLPYGLNMLQLLKSFTYPDPVSQEPRTDKVGLELDAATPGAHGTLNMKVEVQVFPLPNCNCTPWCALGFGAYNGEPTPLYFAGGANAPKGGTPDCGVPEVTVTGPDGKSFPIAAGTGKHQSTPNPAPGLWTVTTKVCGQTKSCSLRIP